MSSSSKLTMIVAYIAIVLATKSSKVRYRALVHRNAFSYLFDLRKVPAHNCCRNDDQKHDACDASTQDSAVSLLFVLLCKPFIPAITCQHPFSACWS